MTIQDYEKEGGFREELGHLREIGFRITTLMEMCPARPHRAPEMAALKVLSASLESLRSEILANRNT